MSNSFRWEDIWKKAGKTAKENNSSATNPAAVDPAGKVTNTGQRAPAAPAQTAGQSGWLGTGDQAEETDFARRQVPVFTQAPEGTVGIRNAMTGYGLDNDKIGYNGQYVTYDGRNFLKPSANVDGTTYANSADIFGAVLDEYRNQGKNVVKATDYVANSGYPFDVSFNNGVVSVAGQTVQPLFIENGYAYMDAADLDRALAQAANQSGYRRPDAILQEYENRYSPYYDELLDRITNREEFSYDPDSDALWQSYRQQYAREGDRAMRDALGAVSGLTGGYTNSAAVTAGAQQRQYWSDQLMDRLPELENLAYNRYLNEFNMDNQALSAVQNVDNQLFNRAYGVNSDIANALRYNNELRTGRDNAAYERALAERMYNDSRADIDYERRLDSALDPLTIQQAQAQTDRLGIENYGLNLANDAAEVNQFLTLSQLLGYWWDEDYARKLGIDPTRSSPRDFLTWQTNEALRQYQGQADIDYDLALREMAASAARSGGGSGSRSSGGGSGAVGSAGGGDDDQPKKQENEEEQVVKAVESIVSGIVEDSKKRVESYLSDESKDPDWIYVKGIGRMSPQEVYNAVEGGWVVEETDPATGKTRYRKK